MHRLSDKDLERKTAVCSICGPTRIIKINQGGRCPVAHRRTNTREYPLKDGEVIKIKGSEREEILNEFGKNCMICGEDVTDTGNLDHCHKTGKWRGVLCRNCNTGLGLFKDDKQLLFSAILYLAKSVASVEEIEVEYSYE